MALQRRGAEEELLCYRSGCAVLMIILAKGLAAILAATRILETALLNANPPYTVPTLPHSTKSLDGKEANRNPTQL